MRAGIEWVLTPFGSVPVLLRTVDGVAPLALDCNGCCCETMLVFIGPQSGKGWTKFAAKKGNKI